MFDHRFYLPILKWRMGEWQALEHLSPAVKEKTVPFLEIPREKWDFEEEQPAVDLDSHLAKLAKAVNRKWAGRLCFFDLGLLDPAATLKSGLHPLEEFFNLVRASGHHHAVPATGLDRNSSYQNAVFNTISIDKRGVSIRLSVNDFDRTNLSSDLTALLTHLHVSEADVDIVVDFKANNFEPVTAFSRTAEIMLAGLPRLGHWRTLVVAGTAFPAQLPSAIFRPNGIAPRNEWLLYKTLCNRLPGTFRVPTFGDYCVSHPSTEMLDMKLLDPNAKIKYTINDAWYIAVGLQVKAHGRGQMASLCRNVVASGHFMGPHYSWGDHYIDECAAGRGSTGGPSTFPTVASNHHITKIVEDLSIFHAP